jgi:hypothetical protein
MKLCKPGRLFSDEAMKSAIARDEIPCTSELLHSKVNAGGL